MKRCRFPAPRHALFMSIMPTHVWFLVGIVLAAVMAPVGLITTEVSAADWPAWRGPMGTGISAEKDLPLDWRTPQAVRWRTPLPEPGNSTPIVSRGRIFLTQSEGTRRNLLCFDRKDGKLLWKTGVGVALEERTHKTNPYASASPVTDGERIIVWFGSAGLAAYDFDGKEIWRTDLGRHDHRFGYGGSPVIQGELCFLNFGPGVREFLVAVDKKTGKEV